MSLVQYVTLVKLTQRILYSYEISDDMHTFFFLLLIHFSPIGTDAF